MQEFLQYTILGLVIGGVYGIAASGLVVTYTTSGIFNFAHGAIAMLGAFTYWQLRWGWGWPAPLALLIVLGVLAPAMGAILYQAIMKNLRGTSEVTKIVVPVGVMLGLLALATWIWNPTPRVARIFPKFFDPVRTVWNLRSSARTGFVSWPGIPADRIRPELRTRGSETLEPIDLELPNPAEW